MSLHSSQKTRPNSLSKSTRRKEEEALFIWSCIQMGTGGSWDQIRRAAWSGLAEGAGHLSCHTVTFGTVRINS